jgi:hypothetical protein
LSANSPRTTGMRARICLCNLLIGFGGGLWRPLSLSRKIAFPGSGDWCWQRLGSNAGSVGWKTEHLALPRPFGR